MSNWIDNPDNDEAFEKGMSQLAHESANFINLCERFPLADNEPKEEA